MNFNILKMRFVQNSCLLLILLCFSLLHFSCAQISQTKKHEAAVVWERIETYFSPHPDYVNKYDGYRSPLRFYNGDTVQTKEDWVLRRQEILNTWTGMLGEWPAVIKDQELEILETVEKDIYIQHKVRFYWTPNELTEGYLLVPRKKGKKPAVITVFYEPETAIGQGGKPNRDFAYQLVQRGFITLSIGTTESTANKTYSVFYPDISHSQLEPLSGMAYAAANAFEVLAKVKDVDASRIGIVGHSFGGKWAMFASCLYEKFACAAWSDGGIVFDESRPNVNYWEPYYLGYHQPPWRKYGVITADNPAQGLYVKLIEGGFDLHELHALMAPRPFLVSGGSEDPLSRWIPLNHTIAVNNLLGYKNRVAMTNRTKHDPNPASNEVLCTFFEYFLKY